MSERIRARQPISVCNHVDDDEQASGSPGWPYMHRMVAGLVVMALEQMKVLGPNYLRVTTRHIRGPFVAVHETATDRY